MFYFEIYNSQNYYCHIKVLLEERKQSRILSEKSIMSKTFLAGEKNPSSKFFHHAERFFMRFILCEFWTYKLNFRKEKLLKISKKKHAFKIYRLQHLQKLIFLCVKI